jgi:hypothetical protein
MFLYSLKRLLEYISTSIIKAYQSSVPKQFIIIKEHTVDMMSLAQLREYTERRNPTSNPSDPGVKNLIISIISIV